MLTLVWFAVALSLLLGRAEGEPPWRSSIAMVSVVLAVALVLTGNEVAAVFTADDLDPQIARYAFEEAQASFANARVALGSFALCSGWVIASTRAPAPLAWLVGHRKRRGPRPQPHRLDELHLVGAIPAVLALGPHRGGAAPAAQLPRLRTIRVSAVQNPRIPSGAPSPSPSSGPSDHRHEREHRSASSRREAPIVIAADQ